MIQKRFIQIASLTIINFFLFATISSMTITILAMTSDEEAGKETTHYAWTMEQIALILNVPPLVISWGLIPCNYLPKFFDMESIIFSSTFAVGSLYMTIPFVAPYGWWCVYLVQAINGCFASAFALCSFNVVSKWTLSFEKATTMSVIQTGKSLGNVCGIALAGIIIERLGWQYVFIIYGSITCVVSIFSKFFIVHSPHKHPTITAKEMLSYKTDVFADGSKHDVSEKFINPPWCDMLMSPAFWAMNFSYCTLEFAGTSIALQFPLYVKNIIKMDITETGLFVSTIQSMSWITVIPISWSSDYLIKRGMRIVVVRKIYDSIGHWVLAVILGLICCTENASYVLLFMCIGEISRNTISAGAGVNFFDISPTFVAAVASVMGIFGGCVYWIGPLILGFLVKNPKDASGWHNLFLLAAGVSIIGNVIFLIFAEGEPQQWDPVRADKERNAVDKRSEVPNSVFIDANI